MGTDKAFAPLDGKPLVRHVLDKVRQIDPAEILIITRTPEHYPVYEGVSILMDTADLGALGGLFVALKAAQYPNVLMAACDMPFLNPKLLTFITELQQEPPYLAIVPRWEGQAEALHAVYHKLILPMVRRRLANGQLSLHRMLEDITMRPVVQASWGKQPTDSGVRWLDALEYAHLDAEGRSFTNVNTPDDLRVAQKMYDAMQNNLLDS
jgi:molybdopterin-guanine dinucleotide biosynthesis protein A